MRRINKILKSVGTGFMDLFKPVVENLPEGQRKEILRQSMVEQSGLEARLQNPDQLLIDKGQNLKLYDTMILDDRIKMAINLKKTLVKSVDWKINPASDEQKDKDIADFVETNFWRMKKPTMNEVIDNLLDAMVYGFKVGEIIWEIVDGKWMWKRVKFQHSVLFQFVKAQNCELEMVKYGYFYGGSEDIPIDLFNKNFICLVYPGLMDDNWYGTSDLMEVYFEWWSKYNIKRWRNKYIQGYGYPVPIVIYDTKKISVAEKKDFETTFEKWQDQMYILVPGSVDPNSGEIKGKFRIEWQQFDTASVDMYQKTLDDIDKAISRKILIPDKIGFTDDPVGSMAQSKVIVNMMFMGIKQIHGLINDCMNDKIKFLVDLNYGEQEEYPEFAYDDITKNIEVNMLNTLLTAGVIDKREKWIRNFVNIPDITEKEQEEIDEAREEDAKKQQEVFAQQAAVTGAQKPFEKKGNPEKQPDQSSAEKGQKGTTGKKSEMKSAFPFNYKKLQEQYDEFEAEFVEQYNEILQAQEERLIKQIVSRKIIETKDMKEIDRLKVQKGELKDLLSTYYAKLFIAGKVDALNESSKKIEAKGEYMQFQVDEDLKWLDREWIDRYLKKYGDLGVLTKADKEALKLLRDKAFFVTGVTEKEILKIIYTTIDDGLRSGKNGFSIIEKIKENLVDERKKYAITIARTNASEAYNTGMMNFFTSPDVSGNIQAYMYSAVLDNRTTEFCREHDGQYIKPSDPDFYRINPPNHYNCRSRFVPIFIGDETIEGDYFYDYENNLTPWDHALQPAEGFGK